MCVWWGRLEKGEGHVILAHLNPKFEKREREWVGVEGQEGILV